MCDIYLEEFKIPTNNPPDQQQTLKIPQSAKATAIPSDLWLKSYLSCINLDQVSDKAQSESPLRYGDELTPTTIQMWSTPYKPVTTSSDDECSPITYTGPLLKDVFAQFL